MKLIFKLGTPEAVVNSVLGFIDIKLGKLPLEVGTAGIQLTLVRC